MKRPFSHIIIAVAVVIIACMGYINYILLPSKVKPQILSALEKATGKSASIATMRYNPFVGLVIRDLAIFDKEKERKFLNIEKLSVHIPLLPVLLRNWDSMQVIVRSPQISLWAFKIDNLKTDIKIQEKKTLVINLIMRPYGGTLVSNATLDLSPQDSSFLVNTVISGVDLRKLIRDTALRDKELFGLASAEFRLTGSRNNMASLRGSGSIKVSDGKLWEIPLLGELANILYMPQLKNVVLKKASGNFTVGDTFIKTDDLKLIGDEVTLLCQGGMRLDGLLDFTVTTQLTKGFIQQSQLEKIASIFTNEQGKFISTVKVYGTLAKPKYSVGPISFEETFEKKLIDIFEDILK